MFPFTFYEAALWLDANAFDVFILIERNNHNYNSK